MTQLTQGEPALKAPTGPKRAGPDTPPVPAPGPNLSAPVTSVPALLEPRNAKPLEELPAPPTAPEVPTCKIPVLEIPKPDESLPSPANSTLRQIPNILLFGETGTGKRSIINMFPSAIGPKNSAMVSSGALGCTFRSQPYVVSLDGRNYKLWDTAGLNEGEFGSTRAEQAFQNLEELVERLSDDGISLLLYCVRGPRIRDIWKMNYDLFFTAICGGKVNIVICITGLENEDEMENWWKANGGKLKEVGMVFAGHACIAASPGKQKDGRYRYEDEYGASKELVRELIVEHCMTPPCKIGSKACMSRLEYGRKGEMLEPAMDREAPRSIRSLFRALYQRFLREFQALSP